MQQINLPIFVFDENDCEDGWLYGMRKPDRLLMRTPTDGFRVQRNARHLGIPGFDDPARKFVPAHPPEVVEYATGSRNQLEFLFDQASALACEYADGICSSLEDQEFFCAVFFEPSPVLIFARLAMREKGRFPMLGFLVEDQKLAIDAHTTKLFQYVAKKFHLYATP